MNNRPTIPPPPHRGGCLCGRTRYTLKAQPSGINACHCTDCKKLSGATNGLMLLAERSAFDHDQGTLTRFRKRALSGREVDIVRCAACGVRLWHEPCATPQYVLVVAGTLDEPYWTIPTSHIFVKEAQPGTVFQPDALKVQAQPQTREELVAAFRSIYG